MTTTDPARPLPALVPPASRLVQLRVLWWLTCDLVAVPFQLALFVLTADHHRKKLRDALAEVDR